MKSARAHMGKESFAGTGEARLLRGVQDHPDEEALAVPRGEAVRGAVAFVSAFVRQDI